RRRPRRVIGSLATSAGAPATTKSSVPSSMLPPSCEASESATAVGAERWRKRNCRSYFGLDYTPHVRIDVREVMMGKDDDGNSLDRRVFLGASTATLLGLPGISLAQQQRPSEPDK